VQVDPTSSEPRYSSGVCNIGPDEITARRRAGHIGLIATERLGRPVTAEEVFRLAAGGDAAAKELVAEVIEALGAGLAVIVNGLNPERLLLAGSVAKSLKPLEKEIRSSVERYAFAQALAGTRIETLAMEKNSTVRGGAALIRYETLRKSGGLP